MSIWFLLILNLCFLKSSAFPGECIFNYVESSCAVICFYLWDPIDGCQHTILDNLYKEYFEQNSEDKAQLMVSKIAIYTHIYMLRWKIAENGETKDKMLKEAPMEVEEVGTRKKLELARVLIKEPWRFVDAMSYNADQSLCYLLMLKFKLFQVLKMKFEWPTPRCGEASAIKQTLLEHNHQIGEWMLSDLMQFLPTRQLMLKHFKAASEQNDSAKISVIRRRFLYIFGFARMTMLCERYEQQLKPIFPLIIGFFGEDPTVKSNIFFELAYIALIEAKNSGMKWRNKIVLEKMLYYEWAKKMFDEEVARVDEKEKMPEEVQKKRLSFLKDLSEHWEMADRYFWDNEKWLREKIVRLHYENRSKSWEAQKWQIQTEETKFLLWENGPKDTSIYHALAICNKNAISEYNAKVRKTKLEQLEGLAKMVEGKSLRCTGKQLKNLFKKDEILADLHLQKLKTIIPASDNDKFLEALRKKEAGWMDLLDKAGIKAIKSLLKEDYFSPEEKLSDSEKQEENFDDAKDEFEEDDEIAPKTIQKYEISPKIEQKIQFQSPKNPEIGFSPKSEEPKSSEENSEFERNVEQTRMAKMWLKRTKNRKASGSGVWDSRTYKSKKSQKSKKEPVAEAEDSDDLREQKSPKNTAKLSNSNQKKLQNYIKTRNDEPENYENFDDQKSPENSPKILIKSPKLKNKKLQNLIEAETSKPIEYSVFGGQKSPTFNQSETSKIVMKNEKNGEASASFSMEKDDYYDKIVGELGINKLSDFSDKISTKNMCKIYLESNFEDNLVKYVNVSIFLRTIEAKMNFIEPKNPNFDIFKKQWKEFMETKLKNGGEEVQFLLDKLYFVHKKIDNLLAEPTDNRHIAKVAQLLREPMMTRIGKIGSEEQKGPGKCENSADEQFDTQFGTYTMSEFSQTLSQMHNYLYTIDLLGFC